MKIVFILLGVVLIVFGVAQGLQLAGLIGTRTFSLPGVAFTVLGIALGAACFKKAFASPPDGPNVM